MLLVILVLCFILSPSLAIHCIAAEHRKAEHASNLSLGALDIN